MFGKKNKNQQSSGSAGGVSVRDSISAEAYDELLGDTYYGQMFGNLITLGTLHLAPEGPELDAFVAHAAAVSATWRNGSYFRVRTHASEDEGVRWIDDHTGERAWGLIVFNSVAEGDVDYTLRCGGHSIYFFFFSECALSARQRGATSSS